MGRSAKMMKRPTKVRRYFLGPPTARDQLTLSGPQRQKRSPGQ